MDVTRWPTVGAVDSQAGVGWGGLWSVLFTAQRAVGALVQVTSFAEGLDLIWLGEELRAAGEDVAARRPLDVRTATAADLGPLSSPDDAVAGRAALAALIAVVIRRADELLADPHTDSDGRWLAGMTSLLFAARVHLTAAGAR